MKADSKHLRSTYKSISTFYEGRGYCMLLLEHDLAADQTGYISETQEMHGDGDYQA